MKTSISPRPLSSGAVAPSRSSRMVDAGRGGLTASVDISIYSRDKLPMVRDGARAPPHHEGPHPEERPLGRVSKDEKRIGSWFETREDALLTMRIFVTPQHLIAAAGWRACRPARRARADTPPRPSRRQ